MYFETFRISYATVQKRLEGGLVGLECTRVQKYSPGAWVFGFESEASLSISCPWRITADGHIRLGHEDREQKFGLPAPLDGRQKALKLLSGNIAKVAINELPADLTLEFEGDVRLEIFNNSGGYEGWQFRGPDGLALIALGGGGLATVRVMDEAKRSRFIRRAKLGTVDHPRAAGA